MLAGAAWTGTISALSSYDNSSTDAGMLVLISGVLVLMWGTDVKYASTDVGYRYGYACTDVGSYRTDVWMLVLIWAMLLRQVCWNSVCSDSNRWRGG